MRDVLFVAAFDNTGLRHSVLDRRREDREYVRLGIENVLVQRYETVLAEQQVEVFEGLALRTESK